MKKILFLMFTFVFGFTIANAKKVEISVDFDYTDANTFNFFYEVRHDTPFSKVILANNNMLGLFYNNFQTTLSSVYDDLFAGKKDYAIYFSKENNNYIINMIYNSSYNYEYLLKIIYDENGNFVEAKNAGSLYFSSISFNPVKRDGRLECYQFFSFWQGNHSFYISGNDSYTLNRYYVDGASYINFTDDDGLWRTILKGWASAFEGGNYSTDLDVGLNLEYYRIHQIISKYTALGYIRNIFYNLPDYDLKNYKSFYLSEIEQGVFLVPKFTQDEIDNVDFNIYLSSTETGSNFLSSAISTVLADEKCTSACTYELGENVDYLNKDYNFFNTILKLDLRNFYTKIDSNSYHEYVYHFFTTTYNDNVVFYYNPTYWNVLVPNNSFSTIGFHHNDSIMTSKEVAIKSWDKVNESVGGVLGSFGNINQDYIGNGATRPKPGDGNSSSNPGSDGSIIGAGDVNNVLSKFTPSYLISSLSTCLNSMFSFIIAFLGSFPTEISSGIYFFFFVGLMISVIKFLR